MVRAQEIYIHLCLTLWPSFFFVLLRRLTCRIIQLSYAPKFCHAFFSPAILRTSFSIGHSECLLSNSPTLHFLSALCLYLPSSRFHSCHSSCVTIPLLLSCPTLVPVPNSLSRISVGFWSTAQLFCTRVWEIGNRTT